MRFHCGISFSWRTIKKYIIPILIGLLTACGFGFFSFIKVNAQSNYDTDYYYYYTDLSSYENLSIDNNNQTIVDILDYIQSLNNRTYEYTLGFTISSFNTISKINLYAYRTGSTSEFHVNGTNGSTSSYLRYNWYISPSRYMYAYHIDVLNSIDDIYSNNLFTSFISCITTNSCSNFDGSIIYDIMGYSSTTITNDSNNAIYIGANSYVMYYSTHDLILTQTKDLNSSSTFYKNIYINDELIETGQKFLTYKDYVALHPFPEPEEPNNNCCQDNTNHSLFSNYVYYFDDKTTTNGLLSNIYILLFLYCFGMLILKFINIVRNTRWK